MIKFYDTNALMLMGENAFSERFAISSVTLSELEKIKVSAKKDDEVKYQARKTIHLLEQYKGSYDVHIFKFAMLIPLEEKDLFIDDDAKILATAIDYDNTQHPDDTIFVTNDLNLKVIANLFFGEDSIESVKVEPDTYKGYKEVTLTNEELEQFYTHLNDNQFNLLINEYLIIKSEESNEIIDSYKWDGIQLLGVNYPTLESKMFGRIKPKDIYQQFAIDSMKNNDITLVGGPAGSGKTFLALGYLFQQLEKGKIDKILIFVNPVGARDCAKLGFYPGTVEEKILSTQAGHVLSSKLGDISEVETLMQDGQLEIIPATDARGYQVPENTGVYVLEAQNLTSDTLRMLLQRVGENSKVIVDADRFEQVDMKVYEEYNGVKKMSNKFKGSSLYGQVDLQMIYRSEIAKLAELLKE